MAGASSTGFNPHLPGLRYKILSKALGATMWFFIFYRAREDGSKLLFGLADQFKHQASAHAESDLEHTTGTLSKKSAWPTEKLPREER